MNNFLESLKDMKNVHFIGIGGTGMFPIAKILFEKGYNISGSDNYHSDTLEKVRKIGIKVNLNHRAENVENADLVVFSTAIKDTNPEIIEAKKRNIRLMERCEILGIIAKEYENLVAISGTHGKSTTTSMITHILVDSDKDPTAVIGASLAKIGGNSCIGNSNIMVCEACEYSDSFLHLHPKIGVITNLEPDHLDYFVTFDNMKKSFAQFASQTKNTLVINGDDKNAIESTKNLKSDKIFYGFSEKNDYYVQNIEYNKMNFPHFDLINRGKLVAHISLNIPGKHNVYNAIAAAIVCINLGVSTEKISKSIQNFKGVHRRFEHLAEINGITIVDDYAHHPTEIKTTLEAAKNMDFKTVWAIFQPHTYSRTFSFLDDFAKSLSIADRVVLTEILAVREVNNFNIFSEDLAKKIDNCVCLKTFEDVTEFVAKNAENGDLVLTMGGGNIYKCANMIVEKLKAINLSRI